MARPDLLTGFTCPSCLRELHWTEDRETGRWYVMFTGQPAVPFPRISSDAEGKALNDELDRAEAEYQYEQERGAEYEQRYESPDV